jgi:hypothetical protein
VADLYRHGYTIADLVLSDSACERIISSLPAVDLRHPTIASMLREPRFAASIGEPGLSAIAARVLDSAPHEWQRAGNAYIVRVHLDPEGGSMGLIPKSHRNDAAIETLIAHGTMADVSLPQGAMLIMAPRLVHTTPRQRVLQIELGSAPR